MTRLYNQEPWCELGSPFSLSGNLYPTWADRYKLRALFHELDRGWSATQLREPGARYMVCIDFPAEETDEARDAACERVEALLKKMGAHHGWAWRLSDRKYPPEDQIIHSEEVDFHDRMHDIGGRGRSAYNESMKGRWSAYYTATYEPTADKRESSSLAA